MYLVGSWNLYSGVPARIQSDFSVLVHSIGGQEIMPAPYLDDTPGLVFGRLIDYNHSLVHDVMRLGQAIDAGQKDAVRKEREKLEANFLKDQIVYELVHIRFNPIDRWKTGQLISTESLATFTSGLYE